MSYLLDTNILSELRKPRMDPGVGLWFQGVGGDQLFVSVMVLGEIRAGVERLRPRDPVQADGFDRWLGSVSGQFAGRILPVTPEVADRWGRLNSPNPLPVVDGILAATALVHGLTLVTRNTRDVRRTGVAILNPFNP